MGGKGEKGEKEIEEKVKSGIRELDELFNGGLPRGSIILVLGEPGTSKTTIIRNFVYKGASEGEKGIYILTNKPIEHVISHMRLLGWDIEGSDMIRFILYAGLVIKRNKLLVGNFDDLVDVAYNCERVLSSFHLGPGDNVRIVMEELSHLFLMNNKEVVFKFLHRLFQIIRQHNATALLEVQKGMLDPELIVALESITDGSIETKRENHSRFLRVSRLEGYDIEPEWVEYRLEIPDNPQHHMAKSLSDWEKLLRERDEEEDKKQVKRLLKDIRRGMREETKKRLLGW